MENLEKVCADLDAVVESECRDLLSAAGELIFSNLWLLYDSGEFCRANFSLDEVLKPVQTESKEVPDALAEKITGYMGALCDLFARVDTDAWASGGDGGGTSGGGDGGAGEDAPAA